MALAIMYALLLTLHDNILFFWYGLWSVWRHSTNHCCNLILCLGVKLSIKSNNIQKPKWFSVSESSMRCGSLIIDEKKICLVASNLMLPENNIFNYPIQSRQLKRRLKEATIISTDWFLSCGYITSHRSDFGNHLSVVFLYSVFYLLFFFFINILYDVDLK